jgi:dTDP-4-dehydrorhamnose 3,5-epimerase
MNQAGAPEAPAQLIEGVHMRSVETHADQRGELCEAWNPKWNLHPDPIAMVAFVTVRPGQVRGWVVHHIQDDRMFVAAGSAKLVLYDAREHSPTHGCVNVFQLGVTRRGVVTIPAGVYHAIQNTGVEELIFVDMPNRTYDPQTPDTSRLPLDTDLIPYRLDS